MGDFLFGPSAPPAKKLKKPERRTPTPTPTPTLKPDQDGDGIPDDVDTDADGDGVIDAQAKVPLLDQPTEMAVPAFTGTRTQRQALQQALAEARDRALTDTRRQKLYAEKLKQAERDLRSKTGKEKILRLKMEQAKADLDAARLASDDPTAVDTTLYDQAASMHNQAERARSEAQAYVDDFETRFRAQYQTLEGEAGTERRLRLPGAPRSLYEGQQRGAGGSMGWTDAAMSRVSPDWWRSLVGWEAAQMAPSTETGLLGSTQEMGEQFQRGLYTDLPQGGKGSRRAGGLESSWLGTGPVAGTSYSAPPLRTGPDTYGRVARPGTQYRESPDDPYAYRIRKSDDPGAPPELLKVPDAGGMAQVIPPDQAVDILTGIEAGSYVEEPYTEVVDPGEVVTGVDPKLRIAAARVAVKKRQVEDRIVALDTEIEQLAADYERAQSAPAHEFGVYQRDAPWYRLTGGGGIASRPSEGEGYWDPRNPSIRPAWLGGPEVSSMQAGAVGHLRRRNALRAEKANLENLKTVLDNIQQVSHGGYVPSEQDIARFGAAIEAEPLEFDVGRSAHAKAKIKAAKEKAEAEEWGEEGVDWDYVDPPETEAEQRRREADEVYEEVVHGEQPISIRGLFEGGTKIREARRRADEAEEAAGFRKFRKRLAGVLGAEIAEDAPVPEWIQAEEPTTEGEEWGEEGVDWWWEDEEEAPSEEEEPAVPAGDTGFAGRPGRRF